MNRNVVQCSPETELSQVTADMVNRHVHHVVMDKDGEPVGILSTLDMVKLTVEWPCKPGDHASIGSPSWNMLRGRTIPAA
jgi:CBS domain-containing protein